MIGAPTAPPVEDHIVLDNISWETYERLLRECDLNHVRMTYDDGFLEIMTLSFEHEGFGNIIGRMIETLTLELNIPIKGGGSTTLKKKLKKKGLESDECYWIANAAKMKGKKQFDVKRDPSPDLAVEVDISKSSLDRMGIYAALNVPEIWRYDGRKLRVYHLASDGKYKQKENSLAFPFLPIGKMQELLQDWDKEDDTSLLRSFLQWVRSEVTPKYEAYTKPALGNGKKSKKSE
ncbi:MAG: Uma2 family endonuclease [Gemmataceae bacterium]|nr:Uma2 family endonuclease [Gemmataceae bacterium]MCI0743420.1 Uma2 family endonuclease [Gemmataceae bacterium]